MVANPTHLIWIDLEMTGLDPQRDQILEIATLVTDQSLEYVAAGPILAIHQPPEVLLAMDDWNQRHHRESGLLTRVRTSSIDLATAETATIAFLEQHVPPGLSPMCGNSICQDRRFLARLMPKLEGYFHYRNLDVSTLKELVNRWAPGLVSGFSKEARHLAMADIQESIAELRYYREVFLRLPS